MQIQILHSKRKTLSLSLGKDGNALVRAPYGVSEEEIFAFVKKHEFWLGRRLAERQSAPQITYQDGDKFYLFGSEYLVKSGRVRIADGIIYLPSENRERALIKLLKKIAFEEMTELTQNIARAYGFSYSDIRISSARGRWGSCSRKSVLAYTFRVAFLDRALCEYIAVHELCHTVHFNHSKLFWRKVQSILPDYLLRRKRLKQCGYVMNVL